MSAVRLFTGIALPGHIAGILQAAVARLHPLADLNWTKREGWHITTKFIGQWQEERLPELKTGLQAMQTPAPFPVHLAGLDYFPNSRRPHTLFAGVEPQAALQILAASLDEQLAPLGCEKERRVYTPHVTLAKLKSQNITALKEEIARAPAPDFGVFQASEFCLYESRNSAYIVIAVFPFASEANAA